MAFQKFSSTEKTSVVVNMSPVDKAVAVFSFFGKEKISEFEILRACRNIGVVFDEIRPYVEKTPDGYVLNVGAEGQK